MLLTFRELRLRYQDTVLGFLWSLLKPLLLGAVLYFALRSVAKIEVSDYHLVLLSALFPWVWFQTSVLLSAPAFAHNGNLIKKIHFPRFVLPFSTVVNNMVHFLLSLPVLLIFLVASGQWPSAAWLVGIPLLMTVQLGLLLGVVLLISSVDVFFRDLEHLTEVLLTLLFYVTPILYPLDLVPDRFRSLLLVNPLASLIEAWRDLLMHNALPGIEIWPALLFGVVALTLGIGAFRRLEGGFADAL